MIEVRNLTKRYGEKLVVDNASFTVNAAKLSASWAATAQEKPQP